MGFGPNVQRRRFELRELRTLRADRDALSTRSRAIFDKLFVPAVGRRVKNQIGNLTWLEQQENRAREERGEEIPEYIQSIKRTEHIEALHNAFDGLNKQIEKGRIITAQQQKMGRRQKPQETQKLKIKSKAPSKQAATFTGRFTPRGSMNALKIRGGIQ